MVLQITISDEHVPAIRNSFCGMMRPPFMQTGIEPKISNDAEIICAGLKNHLDNIALAPVKAAQQQEIQTRITAEVTAAKRIESKITVEEIKQ